MLQHTFCHLPHIGPKKERALWDAGVHRWHDLQPHRLSPKRRDATLTHLHASIAAHERRDGAFFDACLPAGEQWRMFREYRGGLPGARTGAGAGAAGVAYLDIETTGMQGHPGDHVTTIALYDGQRVRTYVHGRNLADFPRDIAEFSLLVTYNGKCFDIPYLRHAFREHGCTLPQPHIDLRYTLARLGFKGGLKGCEKAMGLSRAETEGLDGYFAVVLWREFERTGDERVLDTLLAYNADDVIHLECLMHMAWNRMVAQTPFGPTLRLPEVSPRPNPFLADLPTIERLKATALAGWWG